MKKVNFIFIINKMFLIFIKIMLIIYYFNILDLFYIYLLISFDDIILFLITIYQFMMVNNL